MWATANVVFVTTLVELDCLDAIEDLLRCPVCRELVLWYTITVFSKLQDGGRRQGVFQEPLFSTRQYKITLGDLLCCHVYFKEDSIFTIFKTAATAILKANLCFVSRHD
jgi:hypothetical protein